MNYYFEEVENASSFSLSRENWLARIEDNEELKIKASEVLGLLERERYVYLWDWLGVPIIKMPEEIMLIQRAVFEFRPTAIIEVGVARGGGLVLYHSLQKLVGIEPNVLGIDVRFFQHTFESMEPYINSGVQLLESKSTSEQSKKKIQDFVQNHVSTLVVLDGDHSHDNVLAELVMLDEIMPLNTVILVADTWLEHVNQTKKVRNWGKGNNPATALKEFMALSQKWHHLEEYRRSAVLSESRGGWIIKQK